MAGPIPLRRDVLAGLAAAPLGGSATAAVPPAGMTRTFSDTFRTGVSFFDPATGQGRWKTNYWFGAQEDASSRSLPDEKQIYVDQRYCGVDPFRVTPDGLVIEAAPNRRPTDARLFNPYTGRRTPLPYTSGLITTERSFSQLYGYFEATMSFPRTRGCWPAFWLLGPPHGPHAGNEIDVVEWVASNPRRLFLTTHTAGKGEGGWVDGFDTAKPTAYGVLWTREAITWLVDGRTVRTQANTGLHQPMYLLLNLAIGGWDNNLPEDPAGFPARLVIHSVAAYKLNG